MPDIVVEGKPGQLSLPDPDVIPPAVRRRAAAVDALYQQPQPPSSSDGDPRSSPSGAPESSVEAPVGQAPAPTPIPQPAPAVSSTEDENRLRSQTLSREGRQTNKELAAQLEAAKQKIAEHERNLGELQEQIFRETMQQRRAQPSPPPSPPPVFLTADDENNYGRELLDLTQRAAKQVVAPYIQQNEARLQQLMRENADLKARQEHESRRVLDTQVEALVPDYRDIDDNPRWHTWLTGLDFRSGIVRQRLLNDAISARNAPRVASFFDDFRKEEVATGHAPAPNAPSPAPRPPREAAINLNSLASPGRARLATGGEASVPTKPTYTGPQIAKLYDQKLRGAFLGRETEWARIEADIFAAQHEGRVVRP